jgi:hypothetical protein
VCLLVKVLREFGCVAIIMECLLVLIVSYCKVSPDLSNISLIVVGAG